MIIQKGTQLALKWTPQEVIDILYRIEEDVLNSNVFFLGTAMAHQRLYRKVWNYWKKKFTNDEEIIEHMELIEQLLESNLFETAAKGNLPPAIAIFSLKNNHHWTDRPVIEIIKEEPKSEGVIFVLSETETLVAGKKD
jgi:hypothetical protein